MRIALTEDAKKWVFVKVKDINCLFNTLIEGLGEKNTEELIRLINLSTEHMNQFTK
jgi:hypothetical protein